MTGVVAPSRRRDILLAGVAVMGRFFSAIGLGVILSAGSVLADEAHPVFIWYRSAGECPDGEAFLARLKGRVAEAHIAGAGDPVDFVVTLGSLGKRANGRLERQTRDRTVAIREIDGQDCSEVTEAIALSLALVPGENPPDLAGEVGSAPAGAKPVAPAESLPPPAPPAPQLGTETQRDPGRSASAAGKSRWAVGLQALLATGIAPAPLPGGSAFVELDQAHAAVLPGSTFRAGAVGMFGSALTDVGKVRYRLVAGVLDGCPLRLGSDTLSAAPCLAFEAGALTVGGTGQTARTDTGFWAALGADARFSWRASRALSFEAQAGGLAPLTRYSVVSGEPPVEGYRSRTVGFLAGLGTTARLP